MRALADNRELRSVLGLLSENRGAAITVVLAVIAVAWMVFGKSPQFAIQIGIVSGIFAILSVSLNLVVGYTGLLSIAHVGFYGLGAYVVAIFTHNPPFGQTRVVGGNEFPITAWNFFAALPLAIGVAGVVALVLGIVFSKFRDDFYALATLGFAVIAHRVFLSARYFTRGTLGVNWIPAPSLGPWTVDERWEFLVLVLGFLAIVTIIAWLIVSSSFGRILTAIREDENAIEVFGYRVTYYKLTVFVISGMMASVAGSLFAAFLKFVYPNEFILLEAIIISAIVLIGGLASIWGSILGAFIFVLLEEGLRFAPGLAVEYVGQVRIGLLGLILVILMLFRPQGLVGRYRL